MFMFSYVIDKETVPDKEKLNWLYQYTVGQATLLYNLNSSLSYGYFEVFEQSICNIKGWQGAKLQGH